MEKFPFFAKLSHEMRDLLIKNAKPAQVPKGVELYYQGEVCESILFLTEGTVRVFRRHISGQEITLYFLERYEQCNVNINSAFTDTPAIGTAITLTDIQGYMVPPHIVKQLFIAESAYQKHIFNLFAFRLENMASMIEEVRFDNLDSRLIKWLKNNAIDGEIKVTHDALASHIGTSREVISRLLKTFEKNGILELQRGNIKIK